MINTLSKSHLESRFFVFKVNKNNFSLWGYNYVVFTKVQCIQTKAQKSLFTVKKNQNPLIKSYA